MKSILLASTSTIYGGKYLDYILPILRDHFKASEIIFIPYARPNGISWDDYTQKVSEAFKTIEIKVKGLHTFKNQQKAIKETQGIFVGGGNTFLLLKTLYELNLLPILKKVVESGIPYLGTSAGSNLAGVTIKNTNDMPIVYPPDFKALGLVPFNLNPHYLDPVPNLKHNGETRETRIKEYLYQNTIPVVGLREGSWLEVKNNQVYLRGPFSARIFESLEKIYELEPNTIVSF
ncbi:MAG: dipeptidase PepE [Flavobacteriales bacterium]